MSDAFQDRENNFEKQFANDEALRFRATARRNKALALWVAELKGVTGDSAEKFADDFVGNHVGASDDTVIAALKDNLASANVDMSEHRLHKRMGEEMIAAMASVRAGK